MKRIKSKAVVMVVLAASLGLLLSSCSNMSPATQSAGVGAGVGSVAGLLIDSNNRWRGGVIGGALGLVAGGLIGEISQRAAQEAVSHKQPVAYANESGTQKVEVYPGSSTRDKCHNITEKYYENGQISKVVEREVCE